MNAKFTPGSWRFTQVGSERAIFDADGDKVAIACKFGHEWSVDLNACLIAAAPELYAALESCISQIKALCGPDDVPDGAETALRKARGL